MSFIPSLSQLPLSVSPTFEGPSHHQPRAPLTNKVEAVVLPSISKLVPIFDIKQPELNSPLPSFRAVADFVKNGYGQFPVDLTEDSPSCLVSEETSMRVDHSIGNVGGDARNYTESEGKKLNTQDVPHLRRKYKKSIYWKDPHDNLLTKAVLECFKENEGCLPKDLWRKVAEKVNEKNSLPIQVSPNQCLDRMRTLRKHLINIQGIPPKLKENIKTSWSVVADCEQFLLSQSDLLDQHLPRSDENVDVSKIPRSDENVDVSKKKRKVECLGQIGSLKFKEDDVTICQVILNCYANNQKFSWKNIETEMNQVTGRTTKYKREWEARIRYLGATLLEQGDIPEKNKAYLKTNQWDEIARYILTCLDVKTQASNSKADQQDMGGDQGPLDSL